MEGTGQNEVVMMTFQVVLRFQLHAAVVLSDLQGMDKGLSTGLLFVYFRLRLEVRMVHC